MIVVRELTREDDLGAVLALCKDFFREYAKHHQDFFDTDNLGDTDISGRFLESLDSDTSATIVALDGDKIIAYASLAIRDNAPFYRVKKVGSISALMVDRHYRRKGIGTQIMKACGAYFHARGIKYFTFFTAFANQPAIRLYDGLGMTALHISFLGDSDDFVQP